MADHAPSVAMEAVLKRSCDLPEDMTKIRGYDFNQGVDLHGVLKSYLTTGFQASRMGLAIQEINNMVKKNIYLLGLLKNTFFQLLVMLLPVQHTHSSWDLLTPH